MTSPQQPQGGSPHALTRREFFPKAAAVAVGAGAMLRAGSSVAAQPGSMKYRVLGQTGISLSEIGFGSHLDPANLADPAARTKQIQRGLELGINLFDIYDHSYHQFAPMSTMLAPVRDRVVISLVSVWPENKTMAEIEHALTVFGTDTVDLYRIYAGGDDEASLERTEARLSDMQRAKDQGKIRAVGVSAHDQRAFIRLLQSHPEVDYIMFPFNFRHRALKLTDAEVPDAGRNASDPAPDPGIRDCTSVPCPAPGFAAAVRDAGVGLIAMKPFAGGGLLRLAADDPRLQPLHEAGVRLPQAALQFILQTPEIASTIPAMNSVSEVEQNVSAVFGGPLSDPQGQFLDILNEAADGTHGEYLPDSYRWLEDWRS
jgi:aryl-alcohol dehydrogenase-like predicted oxidoreductase